MNFCQRGGVTSFLFVLVLIAAMVAFGLYAQILNTTIVEKFSARRWDIPTQVYSRPLILEEGKALTPKELQLWLGLLDYTNNSSQKIGTYYKNSTHYTIYTRGFDYGNDDKDIPRTLKIHFGDGKIINLEGENRDSARLEPVELGKIYPESGEDRIIISLDNTPPTLIDALIATEDRNFYSHHGVSIRGTMRAIINNIRGGSKQGGSTLTQQLIKNFYLTSEKSLKRKINEAVMAVLLETNYSKKDILNVYINEINLGQNGNQSINGFGVASQFYFNKPLNEIRLDQQAMLVGLAKGASYYNPRKHPERALERRNTVLHNMFITGKIDEKTYKEAISHDLDVSDLEKIAIVRPKFPDFLDYVRRELKEHYTTKDLQTAGLRIITTLDPLAQIAAENAFNKELGNLRKKQKDLQGALVSAKPETGEIVALVGSGSEFTGFNRAIDAKRQVGSLLKPVIYTIALESGKYNLASGVRDEAETYDGWTPKNYSGGSHGIVPMTVALANSYNQAAVNTGMDIGIKHFVGYLNNLGIKSVPPYPASLLGAVELSPIQILGIYQTFANDGWQIPLHGILGVIDEKGSLKKHNLDKNPINLIPEDTAYLIDFALKQVVKDGTAKAASTLGEVAGKTGTTNDSKDAWFAGYSGNYVSVVWVGRDDNKPIGLTGGSGALPIWKNYMAHLPLTMSDFKTPNNIIWGYVEAGTGRLADSTCDTAINIPYKKGTVSTEPSNCSLLAEEEQSSIPISDEEVVSLEEDTEPPTVSDTTNEMTDTVDEYTTDDDTTITDTEAKTTE